MFSNSNSYLGGGNAGRSPFGQQQPQQPANQYGSQPPGYAGAGMQPQYTGYPPAQPQPQPQQQLQSQYTGYPSQNASLFQQQPAQAPMQQPFQTGLQPFQNTQQQQPHFQAGLQVPPQPPAPVQQPQPTGMTSSQMADSFRASPAQQQSQSKPPPTSSGKIPSVRLSFVTAEDQAKFEQLFKSAVGSEQAISGDKARDLLLRSKLPGDALSQIWMLSDTTKSGQLLFPEFALAMYLCNLKLNGKALPPTLPEKVKNEVSSMVDIISFATPDDQHHAASTRTNVPNFDEPPRQSSYASQPMQQPQPQQPSNSQLLSQLVSQPTGFMQQQSFQPQPSGLTPQPTGFLNNPPQPTGYTGPRPPMPPMPTGFQSNQPMAPLNAQPTGRPGQWGLVNAPATGLPNIDALQQQMMPQQGREGGFTTTGLRGNATVPWAVTKDEKKLYDNLFKAWDGFGKGYILGSQAIEIFGQSGLEKGDLERIWTLADPNNRGRLDLDEFAVAMHLIYRKLNGYPVPNRLPPELIPPSTRNLNAAYSSVKSLLSRDSEDRKTSGGVSYQKNRSFSGATGANGAAAARKDATIFKNNDDDVGYRSSARRRVGPDGRSPSPAQSATPPPESVDDMSLDQLQKKIREKQVLLDAIDFKDEDQADQDEALDRKDKRDAEELFRRIRRLQEDIDSHPNSSFRSGDAESERRNLKRQLQSMTDRLPELASQVRRTERAIAETKLELFRLKDAKAHPNAISAIVGTGPGGAVTESDKLKARAKAMMQQRSAALAGRATPEIGDDSAAATKRFEEENSKVTSERETNDRMVRDVEEGVGVYSKSVEDSLKEGAEEKSTEHERRRWEEGLGVEDEVRDFIFELQRSGRSARVRREDTSRETSNRDASSRDVRSPPPDDRPLSGTSSRVDSPVPRPDSASRPAPAQSSSYSSYKTAEERAAFIKQQAEQRMAERLAALGLRAPAKQGESAQQRQEREQKEKEERARKAEAEDAKREQERQQRLADEQISPPSVAQKPPPPPSRSMRSDPQRQAEEEVIKEQQQASGRETKAMEDEERRQEEELRKEREASEARRLELEEQVRQGKMKKEEERRQRKLAQKDTKEKEERLAAQRAELEAARARERELQRQLEAMDDEGSSDDEGGPEQITPNGTDSTPAASQELPKSMASPPPVPEPNVTVTSPPATEDSKNPYLKRMQSDTTAPLAATTSPPPTTTDNNPFHRMQTQQASSSISTSQTPHTASRFSRPKDDDWSVVEGGANDSSSDEDDDAPPGGGNAKQLASMLFGTMGPPRPASGMGDSAASVPASPPPPVASPPISVPTTVEAEPTSPSMAPLPPPMPSTSAPPPPPMPSGNAPPPPPMPSAAAPPPLPMPSAGAPPAPPPPPPGPSAPAMPSGGMDRGALLGQIQAGKGLKKTQTKDRSVASTAGRVL